MTSQNPPRPMPRQITQLTLFASSTSETSAEISALRTVNVEGLQKVQRFRNALEERGVLYRDFKDTAEFIELAKAHLFDLIVKEWEGAKWASVDAPAQKLPLKPQRPEAVLDKRSAGNAAGPINRASESKGNTLPDEDDFDESDEDEPGLLDHVENLHLATSALAETFKNMSGHMEAVGNKFAKRTEEINTVQHSQAKARTADGDTQRHNALQLRKIINGAADDIQDFVSELAQDVNAYRADNRVMLSEFSALLAARRELNAEKDDTTELDSLLKLMETMKTVRGKVGGFQDVIQKTPALTRHYRGAKRRGVSMLGELIAEISFSIDELESIAQELRG